jgi:type IV pilus assembly protein PilM
MFSLKKKDLVGIDIGSSSVKLVQLKESKEGYQLVKIGMVQLPAEAIVDNTLMDTSSIVEAIRNLISTLGVKVAQAACSISGNSVIIRKIGFPVMTSDELEEQIHWEAEQYIPFDINDVNIDFHILGPDEFDPAKMNVILVASKKDIINDYVAVFNEAGITLTVLDVDSFAVQNAFEINYDPAPDEVIALANIGSNIMNLNIIRDGVSLFTRDVQLGGNLYTEEIQKKLALKSDEAEKLKISGMAASDEAVRGLILQVNDTLSMELYRSVDFYNANANEDKITKMYVSGGCCKTPFLLDAIQKRLSVPVEIIDPFKKIICLDKQLDSGYLKDVGPHVTVAVGLAMRRYADK